VISGGFNPSSGHEEISVLLGRGDGTFNAPVEYMFSDNRGIQKISVGDFDGNGIADVIALTEEFGLLAGINPNATTAITAVKGSDQTVQPNSPFPAPLEARVTDSSGKPIPDVPVYFTAPRPINGSQGGTFPGGLDIATAFTDSSGLATSPQFTANGSIGIYAVTAATHGASTAASFTLENGNPDTASPSSGAGTKQLFTFNFTDPNGPDDLVQVFPTFAASKYLQAGTCRINFLPHSALVYLLNDSGTVWLGPQKIGTATTLSNSQCVIDLSASSPQATGPYTLTVTFSVSFRPAFATQVGIYMTSIPSSGQRHGLYKVGTWFPGASLPQNSVSPNSGSGGNQVFTFNFTDPNGGAGLVQVFPTFAPSKYQQQQSCRINFLPRSGAVYLLSDDGTTWLGPQTIGTAATLSNSQCSIDLSASSAHLVYPYTLSAQFCVSFKTWFGQQIPMFMTSIERSLVKQGPVQVGSWVP
jgi:hypothetical protein